MSRWTPCKRRDFIRRLRALGSADLWLPSGVACDAASIGGRESRVYTEIHTEDLEDLTWHSI